MQPEQILPAFVAIWCVALLVRLSAHVRRGAPLPVGWGIKTVLALAGVGAAWVSGSRFAIYGVSAAWAVLLLIPSLAAQGQQRALMAARPDRARRFSKVVRLLHPFDGWRSMPRLMDGLARAKAGDGSAIGELRRLADAPDAPPTTRAYVQGEIARLTDDWEGFLERGEGRALTPGLEGLRLRALGETGRLEALVADHASRENANATDAFCDLMLLVFAGRSRGVQAVLDAAAFQGLNDKARDFWRATALLVVTPDDSDARELIESTIVGPHGRTVAARRFAGELGRPDALDAAARAYVDHIESRAIAEQGRPRAEAGRVALVTWGIIAANLAGFAAELYSGGLDGPTDLDALFRLGALWPPSVLDDGEWWRLGTALFLHFGVMHLALNMLALALFGRLLEQAFGRLRMAALYAVSGLGSMAFVLALSAFDEGDPQLLVGASGAIFGVVGALVALYAADALAGSRAARRRLIEIAAIVGLQVVFDLMTPEVSFSAHAGGFVVGVVAGFLLMGRAQRPA